MTTKTDQETEAAKPKQPNTVTLSEPIEAHGEKVTELVFRKPLGADITKNGLPYASDGKEKNTIDTAAVSGYISDLAGIPPSAVAKMEAMDWVDASSVVMSFFSRQKRAAKVS